MRISIIIDSNKQIKTSLKVAIKGRVTDVRFKLDTGCNSVLLSKDTLRQLGIDVSPEAFS